MAFTDSSIVFGQEDEELLKNEMSKNLTCEVFINNSTGIVNQIYFYETTI